MARRLSQALRPIKDERGIALFIALMSTLLLTALGLALVMTTMTETMITANYRDGGEAMYAADAGVERAMQDLLTVADWNRILSGARAVAVHRRSAERHANASGGGGTINLTATTNLLNCNKVTTCTRRRDERLHETSGRGRRTTRAGSCSPTRRSTPSSTPAPSRRRSTWWSGSPTTSRRIDDDPDDGRPVDARPAAGMLLMRAEAFGPDGAHSVIEVTIGRTDTTELERGYTGQRGQDEQNRRARKAAVEIAGQGAHAFRHGRNRRRLRHALTDRAS